MSDACQTSIGLSGVLWVHDLDPRVGEMLHEADREIIGYDENGLLR